jgi:tRNA pseudouridine38-40 synthase
VNNNFKIIVEYDGTAYHGWQRQATDNSIQSEIEKALSIITGQAITLTGSGRTDAGVHALGQTANFRCDSPLTAHVFQKALNSLLPKDIVIRSCIAVDSEFHSRFGAKRKIYQYRILNHSVPTAIFRQYAWHIRKPLDLSKMQAACGYLIGLHDFKAFQGQGSEVKDTVRHIFRADLFTKDDFFIFTIEGNGFLRYMVRNIVGCLVDVGLEKLPPEGLNDILLSMDRTRAGVTAPARGLFLVSVHYD